MVFFSWLRSHARMFVGAAFLLTQTGLLAWSGYIHSPTPDEIAYLPSGISHWQFGRFELVRANPPLVRMVAALPVIAVGCETDWTQYDGAPGRSTEFVVGKEFLTANGFRSFWLFAIARWACIPFVLLGGIVCWRWAHELYGPASGLMALSLWCFCPNVLGNGALITPDAASSSLGIATTYAFWKWLKSPDWSGAWLAGLVLGFAELAKTNWLILFVLLPAIWVAWRLGDSACRAGPPRDGEGLRKAPPGRRTILETLQLFFLLALAILVINLGYGFDGSFKPLGEFQFLSRTLRGDDVLNADGGSALGNRFRHSRLGSIPVPLPQQYVIGLDVQKSRVEAGRMAYLFGVWKLRGWWYYYLAAATVKVPLGTWILLAFAIGGRLGGVRFGPTWRDEIVLLAPAIATLVFISSQSGINRHFRYALPIFPFLFIWISSLTQLWTYRRKFCVWLATGAFAWAIGSSLLIYPHSLSYFNELAGGPRGGPRFLLASNTDWGQDLLLIKRWIDDHPKARPIYLAWSYRLLDPQLAGIEALPPPAPNTPGWHLISVNEIHAVDGRYREFQDLQPVGTIGGSTLVFHVPESAGAQSASALPPLDELSFVFFLFFCVSRCI